MQQLSQYQELWFKSIFKDNYLKVLNFSQAQINLVLDFVQNGYIIIDNNIDYLVCDNIINAEDIEYIGKNNEPLRALHAWKYNKHVKSIALHHKFINLIELFYQRKAIPFLTTNFKYGSQVQAHTDAIKYQTFPHGFMCAIWTPLEDTDEQNGTIELFPKSHLLPFVSIDKLPIIAKNATNRYANYTHYLDYLQEIIKLNQLSKVKISLKKGQSIIWDGNLIHAGSKILDKQRTRYTQVTHYYFDNCMYYAPLFSDIPINNIYYWNVINISNSKPVKHYYNGETQALKNTFFKKQLNDLF